MQQMWDDLRIGIIGQGSQYIRISKILKSNGLVYTLYKPSKKTNYYNKEKFEEEPEIEQEVPDYENKEQEQVF